LSPFGSSSAAAVASIAADLRNRLDQLHLRVLRYPEDLYQRIIAGTAPLVVSGTTTLVQAQRAAVQQFLTEGIAGFVDVSGRNWRIGTYAEMATRTASLRAWSNAATHTMAAADINLASVVIGSEAC